MMNKNDIIEAIRRVETAAFKEDDVVPIDMADIRVVVSVLQNVILEHQQAMEMLVECGRTFRKNEQENAAFSRLAERCETLTMKILAG
jgi:hypothetical protein